MDDRRDDFVGRHLIVDASTYTRRNLSSTDTVFALFEALNRNLDMTAVLPPIVCRYPFASDEIAAFCDDIERELSAKARDLSLTPVRMMREFLRRRQLEESGVTGVSIWAESHAAIHTWDEDNYYAFDAFSCRDFRPKDALRLLLSHFDIEVLNDQGRVEQRGSVVAIEGDKPFCLIQVKADNEALPLGVRGRAASATNAAGTMCGGSLSCNQARNLSPSGVRPSRPTTRRRAR